MIISNIHVSHHHNRGFTIDIFRKIQSEMQLHIVTIDEQRRLQLWMWYMH